MFSCNESFDTGFAFKSNYKKVSECNLLLRLSSLFPIGVVLVLLDEISVIEALKHPVTGRQRILVQKDRDGAI